MIPVFAGLYTQKITGINCFISILIGLVSGGLFFPKNDLSGWWTLEPLTNIWHVLASGNLLASFGIAIVASTASLVVLTMFSSMLNNILIMLLLLTILELQILDLA